MKILIDDKKLHLLLEQKKQYIGKKITWDSILSAVSFLISVLLASYDTVIGIPGVFFKALFVCIGIVFTIKSIHDIYKTSKEKYDYSNLLKDINQLNEITHNHSIVIIRDTFREFPNRFLVYEDNRWNCELFLNYKDNPNNESFIKNHISSELKIKIEDIELTYVEQRIHQKLSESAKKEKVYCHKFYRADIKQCSANMKEDCFEVDGKKYHWRTILELESNENTVSKNNDIINYVKELF